MRTKGRVAGRWAACALAALVLVGCGGARVEEEGHGHSEEAHEDDLRLSAEAVARAGLRWVEVASGRLEGRLDTTGAVDFNQDTLAHVSPRVTGRVVEAPARLGQSVRTGDLLARIDSIELGQAKVAYLHALAQEELARENHERERDLYADRITSEREMLAARTEHRKAVVALKTAEETLHLYGLSPERVAGLTYDDPRASLYDLRAPFAGKVVEKHVTLGELVTPESKLYVLADLGTVWVWIDVYERDLGGVHEGDDVRVTVDAFPDRTFQGKVSYLSDRVDAQTRTVRARVDVPNPDEALRPGMFARIELSDPHRSETSDAGVTVLVAKDALQRDGREQIVFVFKGDNAFERRVVRVGRRTGSEAEVIEGVAPGEQVVVEGAFRLKSEALKERLEPEHGH